MYQDDTTTSASWKLWLFKLQCQKSIFQGNHFSSFDWDSWVLRTDPKHREQAWAVTNTISSKKTTKEKKVDIV